MSRIYREFSEEALLSDGKFDIKRERRYFGKITVTHSDGKENGHTYMTISTQEDLFRNPEAQKRMTEEIKRCFDFYFKKLAVSTNSKILVACLGNEKITADSLGAKVADKLLVTSHVFKEEGMRARFGNLCVIKCGVSGTTGIESFDILYGVIRQIKPDLVIVVDTLACGSVSRLGCTVQFSDGGIEPGGGVGNAKKSLTYDSLRIPVLAVGVPLVMYALKMIAEYTTGKVRMDKSISELVIAAKETDLICQDYADAIAEAINERVHSRVYY